MKKFINFDRIKKKKTFGVVRLSKKIESQFKK